MDWKWLHEIEGLNNREKAIGIWLGILIIFFLFKPDVRKSFGGVIRSFFARKIITSYLLSVGYTCIGIYILYRLHGWTPHQFKDAALWCTVTVMKTMMRINEVNEKKDYFKEALKENLKFTLIIEFISETFSFSLTAELILVPVLVMLAGMMALAKYDKKYSNVVPVINWMIILFGLASIIHAIYEIIIHFGEFASADKLREFLLPPFLAIWFLPWLYLMSIWMRFETAFIRFNFKRMNKPLHQLARRTSIRHFLFDPEGLERWTMDLQRHDIEKPADLKESLARLRAMRKAEKNPPKIDSAKGWSPYEAKNFLQEDGIETRHYENLYEDEWGASSPYIKLEEGFLPNHIAYYVSGTQKVVHELIFALSINAPEHEKNALIRFEHGARILLHKSDIHPFPETLIKKIRLKKNDTLITGNCTITLRKENFLNDNKGYSYNLAIKFKAAEF